VAAAGRAQARQQQSGDEWVSAGRTRLSNPALVVFTFNRPAYLRQTLDSLSHVAGLKGFSVYVSQVSSLCVS
jgi:hypothetical protein